MVANDEAPASAFELLGEQLDVNGVDYHANLRRIPSPMNRARGSDTVLVGMSSNEERADLELSAARAAFALHKPLGFYADTFGVYKRPFFTELVSKGQFLFVPNEEEAERARRFYPSTLEVIATGNPVWANFFNRSVSRDTVRIKLGCEKEEDFVICVPFGKDLEVNQALVQYIISALKRCKKEVVKNAKVIICVHPGEDRDGSLGRTDHYKQMTSKTDFDFIVVEKQEVTSSNVLDAGDLVIESASTLGIEAAHLRIPVIDMFSERALTRLERAIGSRSWELCELGCADDVRGNSDQLANLIELYYDVPYGHQLEKFQKTAFPKFGETDPVGAVLSKMMEIIIKYGQDHP